MNPITITPVQHPFRRAARVPGSKSITNRALPLAAWARGTSTLRGVLFADDTLQMIQALETLGYAPEVNRASGTVRLGGRGADIPVKEARLHCGNSGTTIRFLTALLATGQGEFVLDGIPRMRQRPIGQLVDQLRVLGAAVEYLEKEGYPPLRLRTRGLGGGVCVFENMQSSQYVSAVLLAAPYAAGREGVGIHLVEPVTSDPYVQMTVRMMEQFGVAVRPGGSGRTADGRMVRQLTVPAGAYAPRDYTIEPDASNASYFLAAAALFRDAAITIEGLGKGSLQGDVAFADVLHQMGAGLVFGRDFVTVTGTGELHGVDLDMNAMPDMVQTLAVVALFAEGPTTLRNVANLRIKETDRLAALETELRKFGANVSATADSLTIEPPPSGGLAAPAGGVATYDDHRMAMAFAIAGLKVPGVVIQGPECVGKTYPEFFADLAAAVA